MSDLSVPHLRKLEIAIKQLVICRLGDRPVSISLETTFPRLVSFFHFNCSSSLPFIFGTEGSRSNAIRLTKQLTGTRLNL